MFGRFFWVFWRVFRVSFGVLGGSWTPLWRPRSCLGPSWVVGVVLSSTGWAEPRHLARFWVPKGGQDGAKMEPKSDPRRTKIEDKNGDEKRSSRSSWSRLGSILGRLGCRLGVIFLILAWVLQCFLKIHVFETMRCQEATWVDLGPIWEARRLQNGLRGGSKNEMN